LFVHRDQPKGFTRPGDAGGTKVNFAILLNKGKAHAFDVALDKDAAPASGATMPQSPNPNGKGLQWQQGGQWPAPYFAKGYDGAGWGKDAAAWGKDNCKGGAWGFGDDWGGFGNWGKDWGKGEAKGCMGQSGDKGIHMEQRWHCKIARARESKLGERATAP